jgi:methylaspartate mutase epsilon subunit
MGPRGLSVLERLVVRARHDRPPGGLEIWTVDDVEPGVGRVWRVDQPSWLTMNTVAGQVTMYSASPAGPARAGNGPSLAEWLAARADGNGVRFGPNDYAPRFLYGEYLRYVYATLAVPEPGVTVRPVRARVARLVPVDGGLRPYLMDGAALPVLDAVVLATGHSRYDPTPTERALLSGPGGATYVRGDSAADLPLELARPGRWVGVLGLGLTFYDVMLLLTEGRGGRFHDRGDGQVGYQPSGAEPRILAGSRNGMPFPARGRNQKAPHDAYRPCYLSREVVHRLRAAAQERHGSPKLDFAVDIWPLLVREIQLVYDSVLLRRRAGEPAARAFTARVHELVAAQADPAAARSEHGLRTPPLDIDQVVRPFGSQRFASPDAFHERLLRLLYEDIAAAREGNVDHPVKAALDILRDVRSALRGIVDFGGLRPGSHRDDFLGWFHPLYNFLAAGPPVVRVAQAVALIEAGVLSVCGPGMRIEHDPETRRFVLEAPRVIGSRRVVDVLVDARIPAPDLRRDTSPLYRQLLRDGLISEYRNVDVGRGEEFRTGGLAVDPDTFQVIDAAGDARADLYAVGIPTEHTRWFTHMGGGRPGRPSLFLDDADRVAGGVLGGGRPGRPSAGYAASRKVSAR